MTYPEAEQIQRLLAPCQHIVIIQADNPDADSLGSALALEQILHKEGKDPILYCGVDVPSYLRYMEGWDRVSKELPHNFDASIIVDTSSINLLEKLQTEGIKGWVAAKPCIVIDHHEPSDASIDFANVVINDQHSAATGELIFNLAKQLEWKVDETSGAHLMSAILGDTQGLTNQLAQPSTYHVLGELVELGVNRPNLEEARRKLSKMPETIYRYKAKLLERTSFHCDNQLAMVEVPHHEIIQYSPLYNPAPLIQGDMLQAEGVGIAVVLKSYDNGRITAAIRANNGYPIAAKLAEHFGGGGHDFASGFKILEGKSLESLKQECIEVVDKLLHENKS